MPRWPKPPKPAASGAAAADSPREDDKARRPGQFIPQHIRAIGTGKQPGAFVPGTKTAHAIANRMGFHPVEYLISVAQGWMLNPGELPTQIVDKSMRLAAATTVSRFLVPNLVAQSITGAEGGPVAVATLDMNALLKDPEALRAAQMLSLKLSATPELPSAVDATESEGSSEGSATE